MTDLQGTERYCDLVQSRLSPHAVAEVVLHPEDPAPIELIQHLVGLSDNVRGCFEDMDLILAGQAEIDWKEKFEREACRRGFYYDAQSTSPIVKAYALATGVMRMMNVDQEILMDHMHAGLSRPHKLIAEARKMLKSLIEITTFEEVTNNASHGSAGFALYASSIFPMTRESNALPTKLVREDRLRLELPADVDSIFIERVELREKLEDLFRNYRAWLRLGCSEAEEYPALFANAHCDAKMRLASLQEEELWR